jgi:hypothetical protein
MTQAAIRARFRRVVARAIAKADAEHAELLERLRRPFPPICRGETDRQDKREIEP